MPDEPTAASPASRVLPGPGDLRHYPNHNLVTWQPDGVLDDRLVDKIGEWLCDIERTASPFDRFIDLTRITEVAVRTNHLFEFARTRAQQLAGAAPMKSAVLSEDWVGFGIARMYESLMEGTPIEVRAFRDRTKAAAWLDVPVEILEPGNKPTRPN